MNAAIIENIGKMPVNGNRLELPKNEQFSNYTALKKVLLTAGAKYAKCGFVFPEDAQAVKDRLMSGEVINDKKKFQFFATPPKLTALLVEMADVQSGNRVLEPSAGQGAIAEVLADSLANEVILIELMPQNCMVLQRKNFIVSEADFLTLHKVDIGSFDRIVANPPFTKNQDIDHVQHMYKFLAPGGKLVSVMSASWTFGSQKRQVAFREWLKGVNGYVTEVPGGAFRSSGTQVASVIVEITKQ